MGAKQTKFRAVLGFWLGLLLTPSSGFAAGDPLPHCRYRLLVPQKLEYVDVQAIVGDGTQLQPSALKALSNSKLSQVMAALQNLGYREPKAKELLSALAAENPERIAEALRHLKELPLDYFRPEGSAAGRILRMMDEPSRQRVLTALTAKDRAYAQNVAKQIEAIGQPPYATVAVQRSSEPLPSPVSPQAQRPAADFSNGIRFREALVHEYVMAGAKDVDFITTRHVAHCLAVTLYNPKTKQGLIVHLGAATDAVGSFDHMLADIRAHGQDPKDFEARIFGGEQGSPSSAILILASRQRMQLEGIKLAEVDVMPAKYVGGLALDLSTGKVLSDTRRHPQTADEKARMEALTKAGGPAQASPSTSQPPTNVPR